MFKILISWITVTTFTLSIFIKSAMSIEYTAHVHGQAELTIAFEKDRVNINFIAPSETLLGFEHTTSSPEEMSKIASSKSFLSQLNNIIQFNNGKCQVNKHNMALNATATNEHHNHNHAHSQTQSHSEIQSSYELICQNTENITSASINVFNQYPALERVQVIWLGYFRQGSAFITPENTKVSFQ